MKQEQARVPSLPELELEAEAEAREFARVRLQQKLQEIADRHGGTFPPQRANAGGSASAADAVAHCHQQFSLALEDKLAFTVTATVSYILKATSAEIDMRPC